MMTRPARVSLRNLSTTSRHYPRGDLAGEPEPSRGSQCRVAALGTMAPFTGKRECLGGYHDQDVAAHVYDAALVMKDGVGSSTAAKKLNFHHFWKTRAT